LALGERKADGLEKVRVDFIKLRGATYQEPLHKKFFEIALVRAAFL
jgi:hypothetical protein